MILRYMRDNHTFRELTQDVEVAVTEMVQEWRSGWTSGSLFWRHAPEDRIEDLHLSYSMTQEQMEDAVRQFLLPRIPQLILF